MTFAKKKKKDKKGHLPSGLWSALNTSLTNKRTKIHLMLSPLQGATTIGTLAAPRLQMALIRWNLYHDPYL